MVNSKSFYLASLDPLTTKYQRVIRQIQKRFGFLIALQQQLTEQQIIQERAARHREKRLIRIYGKLRHCRVQPPFLREAFAPVPCSLECKKSYQEYLNFRRYRGRLIFTRYQRNLRLPELQRQHYQLVLQELPRGYHFFQHRRLMTPVFPSLLQRVGVKQFYTQYRTIITDIVTREHFTEFRRLKLLRQQLHREIQMGCKLKEIVVNRQLRTSWRNQRDLDETYSRQVDVWRFSVGDFAVLSRRYLSVGFKLYDTFVPLNFHSKLEAHRHGILGNLVGPCLSAFFDITDYGRYTPKEIANIKELRKIRYIMENGGRIRRYFSERSTRGEFVRNFDRIKATAESLKRIFPADGTEVEMAAVVQCCDTMIRLSGTPDYSGPDFVLEIKYYRDKFQNSEGWKSALIQTYCYQILSGKPGFLVDLAHGSIYQPIRIT